MPTDLQLRGPFPLVEAVPDLQDMWIDHPDQPAEGALGQPDKLAADPAAPACLALVRRKLRWPRPVLPQ